MMVAAARICVQRTQFNLYLPEDVKRIVAFIERRSLSIFLFASYLSSASCGESSIAMPSLSPEELQYQLEHQYQNRAADIIKANTIMLAAAYVALALRFVSRRLMRATLAADDWMIVLGLVS